MSTRHRSAELSSCIASPAACSSTAMISSTVERSRIGSHRPSLPAASPLAALPSGLRPLHGAARVVLEAPFPALNRRHTAGLPARPDGLAPAPGASLAHRGPGYPSSPSSARCSRSHPIGVRSPHCRQWSASGGVCVNISRMVARASSGLPCHHPNFPAARSVSHMKSNPRRYDGPRLGRSRRIGPGHASPWQPIPPADPAAGPGHVRPSSARTLTTAPANVGFPHRTHASNGSSVPARIRSMVRQYPPAPRHARQWRPTSASGMLLGAADSSRDKRCCQLTSATLVVEYTPPWRERAEKEGQLRIVEVEPAHLAPVPAIYLPRPRVPGPAVALPGQLLRARGPRGAGRDSRRLRRRLLSARSLILLRRIYRLGRGAPEGGDGLGWVGRVGIRPTRNRRDRAVDERPAATNFAALAFHFSHASHCESVPPLPTARVAWPVPEYRARPLSPGWSASHPLASLSLYFAARTPHSRRAIMSSKTRTTRANGVLPRERRAR